MTKTLNQIFFFLHQNQNSFSATLGIRIFFLEENHNPPPPLFQVKWSFPKELNNLGKYVLLAEKIRNA
jgi:hypothetical protein